MKIEVSEEFVFNKQIWKITHTFPEYFLAMYCGEEGHPDYAMFKDHMLTGNWRTDQALFKELNGEIISIQEPTGIFFLPKADPRYLEALGIKL